MASFNDPRCDGGAVCPNDPLLFTCTDSPATSARATLPSGVSVAVTITNMTEIVGAASLPDGVDIQLSSGLARPIKKKFLLTDLFPPNIARAWRADLSLVRPCLSPS